MPRGELDEVRFQCDARLDENSAGDIGVSVIGVLRGTTVEIFGVWSDIIAGKSAPTGFMCATEHCGSWLASDGAISYSTILMPSYATSTWRDPAPPVAVSLHRESGWCCVMKAMLKNVISKKYFT
ncbi:hypothetical protein AB7M25_002554 [Pseudomonas sp. AP3_22 TE3818]